MANVGSVLLEVDRGRFASWALNEINSNVKRSMLAEYLVELTLDGGRPCHAQWDDFDTTYCGRKVEIKSSGYISPPFPTTHFTPNPRFDIAPRSAFWSHESAKRIRYDQPARPADIYIFCVHEARSADEFRPFDANQWLFVAVPTERLNRVLGEQKSLSLAKAKEIGVSSKFGQLRSIVDSLLGPKAV